jgi:predicted NBD/HSP70 family sugar kinase
MRSATLALDIGATKIVIGRVLGERARAVERHDTAALIRRGDWSPLAARLRVAWKPNVRSVALGIAGVVEDGVVLAAPNFPAGAVPRRFPIARYLGRRLGVPVTVANDTECFAFGEAAFGAGRRRRRVVGLTLGTGLGGGIVLDGLPYRGACLAGEFGHLPFPSAATRCGCGQIGHLETILSGPGLSRLYALASGGRVAGAPVVARAARRGDAAAVESLGQITDALAHLLLTVLVAWDPDVVVVGGGLASIPRLLVNARRLVRERTPHPALRRVPIVPSLLHDHAVLLGAVRLATVTHSR